MKPEIKNKNKLTRGWQIVESEDLVWINIATPTTSKLKTLQKICPNILDSDLSDCLPPFQRPKVISRNDYIFMVLLFPIYDKESKTVQPVEIDFFVGADFVITTHSEMTETLINLSRDCHKNLNLKNIKLGTNSIQTTASLLIELQTTVFPIMTKLSNDILMAETEIFNEAGRNTVKKILGIKSNIVQCRQTMQSHKTVIRKFIELVEVKFIIKNANILFDEVIEHTKEIWDYLENDKETIDAVYDSHTSLMAHNSSRASQRLTALAFIILPTALVTAIFAMSAEHIPISGHPYDFWIMLLLVFATMFGTVVYLKWKRWL